MANSNADILSLPRCLMLSNKSTVSNPAHDEDSSRARAGPSICTLSPELFPLISDHLPRTYRSASLLTLAMACRRLRDVIIPHVLYREVWIEGETPSFEFFERLREEAALANGQDLGEEEGGCMPRSHHIHFLSLSLDSDVTPGGQHYALREALLLVQCGGLLNLESLNIRLSRDQQDQDPMLGQEFWSAVRNQCPRLRAARLTGICGEKGGNFWEEPGLLQFESLKALSLEEVVFVERLPMDLLTFSSFTSLSYLELRLRDMMTRFYYADALLTLKFPCLRTLILDGFVTSQRDLTTGFWLNHSGLRNVILGLPHEEQWFPEFDSSMLPNLAGFGGFFEDARVIIPHAAKRLERLMLLDTHNAQAPYLLRAVAPEGVLPALRSLTVELLTWSHPTIVKGEGNRWREDEGGRVTQTSKRRTARWFDGNYIMSISKAAPNLEELELSGTSCDTLESLRSAFSRFAKLNTLVLSGATDPHEVTFFESWNPWNEVRGPQYAPTSFEQAARDLGGGCPSLEVVCVRRAMNKLSDLAYHIVRGDDGTVTNVVLRKTGTMNVWVEEDW